jgi:hypothetical protein
MLKRLGQVYPEKILTCLLETGIDTGPLKIGGAVNRIIVGAIIESIDTDVCKHTGLSNVEDRADKAAYSKIIVIILNNWASRSM